MKNKMHTEKWNHSQYLITEYLLKQFLLYLLQLIYFLMYILVVRFARIFKKSTKPLNSVLMFLLNWGTFV